MKLMTKNVPHILHILYFFFNNFMLYLIIV
jgi:hypothetical protein